MNPTDRSQHISSKEMKRAVASAALLCSGLAMVIPTTAHAQILNRTADANEESLISCLASESDLVKFSSPERTWAFFLQSLRTGDRKAALSALLAGDLKNGLASLLNSMSPEKMKAMAESFGPLSHEVDMGNMTEFLMVRTVGTASAGTLVRFEYHRDCGGWRLVAM